MNIDHEESKTSVGVIGLGDLGKRLVAQLLCSNYEVVAFDPTLMELEDIALSQGVDPAVNMSGSSSNQFRLVGINQMINTCKIVHWAVPSAKLSELPPVPQNCIVVLHDSVMTNSREAVMQRNDRDQFVIAHCLMNDSRRVFVDTEFGDNAAVMKHFEATGLSPKRTTVKAHDVLMARTQGVFALLIELGIREELDTGFAAGDLTPSAIELRSAVINREANWTARTLQSILGNPELKPFVNEISGILANSTRDIKLN